ncbi:MAG: hypothetical protein K9J16_05510 [Melioribacteraceae bacterium]|nr:hypothetical protein [Melioribacteraceae bacterium]MCF8353256.1 hypothetical protein [Melioribacteraceae bacterium]MCF8395570.1 hypothetical protein [Melioribacteraceae bacterium]MCF8418783.1 hypothetical protein [Melioribacteraceae bacterium]
MNTDFRNRIYLLLIFFLVSSFAVNSQELYKKYNGDDDLHDKIVAEVGPLKITAEEFFYSYEFGPAFIKKENGSKQKHLKYLVNEKLIALAGYDEELLNDEKVSSVLSDFVADLATEEMYKEKILSKIKIDEAAVDTILESKLVEIELKWLFSNDMAGIKKFYSDLQTGASFDSLFDMQLNDSVFSDMRSMKTTAYSLRKNNSLLMQIIDTLKAGNYSAPIHVNNEWYIIKLSNLTKSMITNQTEFDKLNYEAEQAVLKSSMDTASDQYIDSLMRSEYLIIKKDAFELLRAYMGKYVLEKSLFEKWELEDNIDSALSNLGLARGEKYPGIKLVNGTNVSYDFDQFINWYRNRNLYIKFNKNNLGAFTKSLENLVWRFTRDKLLTGQASGEGFFNREWVKTQSKWWRDKIVYSAMKNKLAESILLENDEIKTADDSNTANEMLAFELIKKMHRTIEMSKQKNKIKINDDVFDKINVTTGSDLREVDLYTAKTGGLIPRPPYPTIDNEWANWE